MVVAGVENQVVLQDQGGNPDIIGRDWRPLLAQLAIEPRVVVSRLVVGEQHVNTVLHEELAKGPLVLHTVTADCKSCSQLPQDDEGQKDILGRLQSLDNATVATTEIRVSVGVESDSHFQSSGSMAC